MIDESEDTMHEDPESDRHSESEGLEQQPEPGHPVAGQDAGAPDEGAGARKAEASQPIADDGNKEETQRPAPDDDVGVPDDPGSGPG
jgi:hypothetical protein